MFISFLFTTSIFAQSTIDVSVIMFNTEGTEVELTFYVGGEVAATTVTDELGFAYATLDLDENMLGDSSITMSYNSCTWEDIMIYIPFYADPTGLNNAVTVTADYCPGNGGGGGDEICNAEFEVMQGFSWIWDNSDSLNVISADTTALAGSVFAFVYNYNPNATYSWSFGDEGTSSEPFPTWVYETYGPYELCLTVTSSAADGTVFCTDTYCTTIELDEDGFLGLVDGFTLNVYNASEGVPASLEHFSTPSLVFNIYPNPSENGQVNWFHNATNGLTKVDLINSGGSIISSIVSSENSGSIEVNDLPSGLYFVRLYQNGIVSTKRVVIK